MWVVQVVVSVWLTSGCRAQVSATARGSHAHRWYAVVPRAAVLDPKKDKEAFLGWTGGFGRATAPSPPEMAMCILRGLTTSYMRHDAASAVAIVACARVFGTAYGEHPRVPETGKGSGKGSVKVKARTGKKTAEDFIENIVRYIRMRGYGYKHGGELLECLPKRMYSTGARCCVLPCIRHDVHRTCPLLCPPFALRSGR